MVARSKKGKKKGKKSGLSVDFTGVESGGRAIKDGTYRAEVVECEEKESEEGNPYLNWKFKLTPKKGPAVLVYDVTSLQPQALWRLRLLLETIGEEIPDGVMDLDPPSYIGRELEVEITNEKYEGRDKPRITGFMALTEEGEEDENEESEEEEDEEEEESEEEDAEEDEEEEDEEESEDEEEEDEDEEEEEEEEEKPKAGKKPAGKTVSSKFKVGAKVKFKDEDGKFVKGVVTSNDGRKATVEDADGDEWEVETSELKAA
jgi:hypothetical protein